MSAPLQCPMRLILAVRDEDTDEITEWRNLPCDAELHVEFTGTYGLTLEDLNVDREVITAEWSHATDWEIRCSNGHMLTGASATTMNAGDTAEPLHIGEVLRALLYGWDDEGRPR